MKYNIIVCGGTFDYLHTGHQAFLEFAFSAGEKVLIGLTTDAFVREQKKETVHSFTARKHMLETFLQEKDFLKRAEIIPIDTVYGFALDQSLSINAIVVTDETKANAEKINQKREEKGLSLLPIVTMPLVTIKANIVSSSAIREGTIDTQGNAFINPSVFSHTYQLPPHLRSLLRKPFGRVIKNGIEEIARYDEEKIITVGDVTTQRFHEENIHQKIAVVDFVIERKKSNQTLAELGFDGTEEIIRITNPPGTLTPETWKAVKAVVTQLEEKKKFVIEVNGEEDLLVIPLVLTLPLGFHVFYGQPGEGLVAVEVTLDTKQTMQTLFQRFTRGY